MSSIFDDKKLIEQLIKAGQQANSERFSDNKRVPLAADPSFQKSTVAPAGAGELPSNMMGEDEFNKMVGNIHQSTHESQMQIPEISRESLAAYNLAKKLILGLRSQIVTNPNDPDFVQKSAPIGFDGEAPDLKPENAKTLGDFLTWCSDHNITWGGQPIVWKPELQTTAQAQPAPAAQQSRAPAGYWTFQSYVRDNKSGAALRDPDTRQGIQKEYYANKEALIQFLTHLRDSTEAKSNEVLKVMLGGVIKEANKFLQPNEQLGVRPEQKQTAQFNDNEIVDGFDSNIIDVKNPYQGIENNAPAFTNASNKLTHGNIKDLASLQDWIGGMREKGKENEDPMGANGDPCGIIHVLYLRATYLSKQVRYDKVRPKYNELAKLYLQNVTNLGRQLDFNGKPCAVTAPGTTDQAAKPAQPRGTGGVARLNPNILRQLASLKIFDVGVINLTNIVTWVKMFSDATAGSPAGSDIAQIWTEMNTEISKMQAHVTRPWLPIQTNWFQSADRIRTWATGEDPLTAISALKDIMRMGGQAYSLFVDRGAGGFGEQIIQTLGAGVYQECYNQVSGSGSPWAANVAQLDSAYDLYMAKQKETVGK